MAFWRMGEAIVNFQGHKAFNFVGFREIRRQLRGLRLQGVGETLFVGTTCSSVYQYGRSSFRIKTSKRPFVDYFGRPARLRWVCRNDDVVQLLNGMRYECPRCCSHHRPRRLKPEFLRTTHDLDDAFNNLLLCDHCREMEGVRDQNRVAAAVQEITEAQQEIKNLQRRMTQ